MANSFSVFTYNPKQVQLIVAGYQITGWESISIARSVDGFTPVKGIRGKHTRDQSLDTSATITVPILQTSQSNEVLSEIHRQDFEMGTGRIEIILRDKSGTSVFSSVEAYILGYPVVTFSGGAEYREWRIFLQSTTSYNVGANAEAGMGSLLSNINSAIDRIVN